MPEAFLAESSFLLLDRNLNLQLQLRKMTPFSYTTRMAILTRCFGAFLVKKLFKRLTTIGLFAIASLVADDDINLEDISNEQIKKQTNGPFSIEMNTDWIGPAKLEHHHHEFSDIKFATAQIDLSLVYYYNPCHCEGASIGLGYTRTRLDWKCNPFFTQNDYDMISVNLAGVSQRFKNWTWKGQVTINFDNIEHWNLEDYMTYDLLFWGRYAYRPNLGVHLGFLVLAGMKIDRVYPIVGFDWTYSDRWKLSLVFPMDISLTYTINRSWSVLLAGRFFNQRHRVKKDQFFSQGVWFYTSSGAELAVKYRPSCRVTANLHAGLNFGGHLKVANRHYREGHRLRFGEAPYAGAEVDINF